MQIVTIAAVAENGVIGDGKDIPWKIEDDWERFRRLTTGNFLLMGRSTYEAIGRPLPNRTTVVITHQDDFEAPAPQGKTRVLVAHSIEEGIRAARTARGSLAKNIIYVAGGGEIYAQTMDVANALDITEVKLSPEGTVHFPEIDREKWLEIRREQHETHDYVKYVPVSHTARLTLVPATPADAPEWTKLASHPVVAEQSAGLRVRDEAEAAERLARRAASWDANSLDQWTIRRTEDNEFVGIGGLRRRELENGDHVWLLDYQLVPELQGNGYTPEMVRAALEQVRQVDREARVRAMIRPRNVKSIEIAEQAGLKKIEERTDPSGQPIHLFQGWVRELV
ncbi:dihydrofolate reductase [Propionibacteriaceae bacterium Y1923]|uniref:dihydrofolate reductase n=1 Tax=Aestuariimicrobium sp. Y1814 TaxID=3418742 RepID=UPI003C2A7514